MASRIMPATARTMSSASDPSPIAAWACEAMSSSPAADAFVVLGNVASPFDPVPALLFDPPPPFVPPPFVPPPFPPSAAVMVTARSSFVETPPEHERDTRPAPKRVRSGRSSVRVSWDRLMVKRCQVLYCVKRET